MQLVLGSMVFGIKHQCRFINVQSFGARVSQTWAFPLLLREVAGKLMIWNIVKYRWKTIWNNHFFFSFFCFGFSFFVVICCCTQANSTSILLFFRFLRSLCFSTISSAYFLDTSSIKDSKAEHSQLTFLISCLIFSFCKSKFFFVFSVFITIWLSPKPSFDLFWFAMLLILRGLRTWVDEREALLTMLSWIESSTSYSYA